ncbi:MAG: protease complex subunit PrcB family protein [Gammaproteobacteria bacterium]|nr:protease complex subunit PrcB family protein [Gammaproteobacteria bacterium]
MNSKLMKSLILSVATALLMAGCATMGGGATGVDVLASGNHSNMKDQQYSDIHNQADLDALWKKAFAGQSSAPDEPKVDFNKNMVLAAFIGEQNTGGYNILFSSIDASGASVNVTVLITQPGQNCLRSQAAQRQSEAYLIATAPASAKPVNFNPSPQRAPGCG